MLSESIQDFLRKTGYYVSVGKEVVAVKYQPKRSIASIVLVTFLLICFTFILLPNYPLFIGSLSVIVVGFFLVWLNTSKRVIVLFDLKEKSILVPKRIVIRQWVNASTIEDIDIESKMRTEVNHPFKDMDEDFIISLSFHISGRKNIPFLFFPSDLQSPSVLVKEVRKGLLALLKPD